MKELCVFKCQVKIKIEKENDDDEENTPWKLLKKIKRIRKHRNIKAFTSI